MSVSMAIFTFINVWCVTLFVALPLGIIRSTPQTSLEYAAAPKKIHWRKIFRINTLVAAIVTALIALIIKTGIIPVR